jgi:hypothetical protein
MSRAEFLCLTHMPPVESFRLTTKFRRRKWRKLRTCLRRLLNERDLPSIAAEPPWLPCPSVPFAGPMIVQPPERLPTDDEHELNHLIGQPGIILYIPIT